jgi:menaquinone-dependent protoporphyrinogen oxidase
MNVLVTWGSKRGGTEGLARIVGDALEGQGLHVTLRSANEVADVSRFDAVVVGGALYVGRWHPAARKFVARHAEGLRCVPVWFFSSGPLDDTADRREIAPTKQVSALMKRVDARGHATFGGRLTPDARGFVAGAMVKKQAGDWRSGERVRAWAREVALSISTAPKREPHVVRPRTEPFRELLAALSLLAGLTAIWGGAELVLSPDGSLMRLPLSLLEHSPFHDFRVPGLLLAIFVGGINTLAGMLVVRRHPRANAEAMVSGPILATWIVIEVLLIRPTIDFMCWSTTPAVCPRRGRSRSTGTSGR